jgi:ubiquinone/menaquinone biosynthesis C-methylase UbiE
MAATQYLHGFSRKEQNRLIHQAEFLEDWVYEGVDLKKCRNLLEVGCGVGAQTKILLRRFPGLHIDAVDFSPDQLAVAKVLLKKESARIHWHHQDAQKLQLGKKMDAAFLCWFLEHVPNPLLALKQVYKHLKPGARIYCTEVFNHTLFLEPYSPACIKYWSEFNDFQWTIKGHPFVGGQLGHLLKESGFKKIETEFRSLHFDSRNKVLRNKFIDYFFQILLSAEKVLLEDGRVTPELIQQMKNEVATAKSVKEGVFFYSFARAVGCR